MRTIFNKILITFAVISLCSCTAAPYRPNTSEILTPSPGSASQSFHKPQSLNYSATRDTEKYLLTHHIYKGEKIDSIPYNGCGGSAKRCHKGTQKKSPTKATQKRNTAGKVGSRPVVF